MKRALHPDYLVPRYLSLFDGIGAACVAWGPMGWQCVGKSEIEPFPIAVTKQRQPDVPHLGSVSDITEAQIAALGRVDLIVGGFPCQDLSVAGKRAGLRRDDGSVTRSGLFFDAMRVVRWARKHCGLRWLLIENVPGLYSSHRGRDFAAVVSEMAGADFGVPPDGWRNAGVALGPDGLVEWATLDAQFFGLAQRRVRVFALADFGDWRSRGPVLFERASLSGHPAPSREAGERVAATVTSGAANGGRAHGAQSGSAKEEATLIPAPRAAISPAIKARDSKGASSDGDGDGAMLVPMVAHPLLASGFDAYCATTMQVRRLTPRECCRLQGFPDDYLDITYRGKPAADGNRYKALGNSFAVPVVAWIGERIETVLREAQQRAA